MQQMKTLMAQIRIQFNKNNTNGGNKNNTSAGKISTGYHFGDNSTSGLMVHAINMEVVVNSRKKATKTI